MYDQVLRATAFFSHSTAFASKVDATGETPRSLAKSFSRVRIYAAAVRYDVNTFCYGLPDVGAYRHLFRRLRPPYYTARARVNYPLAKQHLRADYFLPYALYGWNALAAVTPTAARTKWRKYGLTVTGRAYGAPRFSFHYVRNYLYLRRSRKLLAGKRRFGRRYRRRYRPLYLHMPRRVLSRFRQLAGSLRLRAWRGAGLGALSVTWPIARRSLRVNVLTFSRLAALGPGRLAKSRRHHHPLYAAWAIPLMLRSVASAARLNFLRFCHWQRGLQSRIDVAVPVGAACGPVFVCPTWRGLVGIAPATASDDLSATWAYHLLPTLFQLFQFYGHGPSGVFMPGYPISDEELWLMNLAFLHALPWVPVERQAVFTFRTFQLPRAPFAPAIFEPEATELRLSLVEAFMGRFIRRVRQRLSRASSLLPIALVFYPTVSGSTMHPSFFNFALYPTVYHHQTLGRFRYGGARYKHRALRGRLRNSDCAVNF